MKWTVSRFYEKNVQVVVVNTKFYADHNNQETAEIADFLLLNLHVGVLFQVERNVIIFFFHEE